MRNKTPAMPHRIIASSHHRAIHTLAVLLLLITTTACGLTPVYKQGGDASHSSATSMPPIALELRKGRLEQQFRVEMENALATPDGTQPAAYRLLVTLSKSRYPIGIEKSGRISRYNIAVILTYRLIDAATGEQVEDGSLQKLTSYNIVDSDYASYVAERDADKRALAAAAQELRKRLILYFAKR